MFKERNLALGAVLTVAVLAACGGGGGGGGSVPSIGGNGAVVTASPNVAATATAAAGQQLASVSITLGRGTFSQSATARRTNAIGTGTRSIVFTLLQQNGTAVTGTPQSFGLTASSAGCTVNSGTGNLTCTLPVSAPVGSDVFLAQTYDGLGGTGNLTGSGALALSIGVNTANTANIVLNAQVASVFLVAGNNTLGTFTDAKGRRSGNAVRRPLTPLSGPPVTSTPIFVIAIDSSGNTILNPSAYSSPIYLQLGFIPFYTADVTLQAVYAANDPAPCTGGTASASSFFASLPICSPGDTVSASLSANGGSFPSYYAYIYGYISATSLLPTPAPSSLPSALPSNPPTNSFVQLTVFFPTPSPTPTPVPTPTGPVGTLPVTGQ